MPGSDEHTVTRPATERERALTVLLEIAEDEANDAAVRARAAEIVLARHDPSRRLPLGMSQQAAR